MSITKSFKTFSIISLISLSIICSASNCFADEAETVLKESQKISLWSTIASGGIIGYLIIIVSIGALALVIDNMIRLKRDRIIPDDIADELQKYIKDNEIEAAEEICKVNESFLCEVVKAGLLQKDSVLGFYNMQNSMQEASERYISKLFRRIDYLAFIASAAPMLGLLGTVTGMIKSFNQIAITEGGARAAQLAGGISEALMTTCLGLIVAIPTMFFVTFFKNKIDSYVAEVEPVVDKMMSRFKNQ